MAPGSAPDDPVLGLVPCFFPPRMLQSGASFYRILSVASDAPVRGTGFTPGRSSPGASAMLHSSPVAPIRGVFLSYSLRRLERSSPWRRDHPRTIQSGEQKTNKDITIREGRWRVGFHDSEQSEFFCSMVDGKVKYKGTILKVRPWIFSYGVEQIWDQLEKYANLERQKSQDAQGFGGKVSAVGEKGCSVCTAL